MASMVEFVEALTIVLAVGILACVFGGWRLLKYQQVGATMATDAVFAPACWSFWRLAPCGVRK